MFGALVFGAHAAFGHLASLLTRGVCAAYISQCSVAGPAPDPDIDTDTDSGPDFCYALQVDYRVMLSFLELYESLLTFVRS